MLGGGGGQIDPPPPPGKTTLKKPSLIRVSCEIELILTWSKNCALTDIKVRAAGNNNDPSAIVSQTGLEFQITHAKLYVPVVTLSKENDKKCLQ